MNVAHSLFSQLESDPARIAIREQDGRVTTRAELLLTTWGLAAHLVAAGVQPGDRVVLLVPNGPRFAASALAVLACGAVVVLCEPGLGDEVTLARLRAAEPRWAIVDSVIRTVRTIPGAARALRSLEIDVPPIPSFPGLTQIDVSDEILDELGADHASRMGRMLTERAPVDDAMIVFTSGTTSEPKGVRLSHGAVDAFLSNIETTVASLSIECFLADTPPQLLYALRMGKVAAVARGRKSRRARAVLRFIEDGIVDSYFGAPYVWLEILRSLPPGARLPPTLRNVLLGSAPVPPSFLRRLRERLAPSTEVRILYGLTEVGPACSISADEKMAWTGGGDLVGAPLEGVRVGIVPSTDAPDTPDASNAPDADEGIGEVTLGASSLYTGYLGAPIRRDDEPLRTGDFGRIVMHGGRPMLLLLGRTKDMIVRRGVNIYPSLFEPAIMALPRHGIESCALLGIWDDARADETVTLAYTANAPVDERAFRHDVALVTGIDAAPDDFVRVGVMPVAGRQNKIDRAALRRLVAKRSDANEWQRLPGARVPFAFGTFYRKYKRQIAREPILQTLAQALVRLVLLAVAQLTWTLDELVARRWRQAKLREPVFIVGHQRSGTTLMHRVLASDDRAVSLTLQEMLLPSVSAQAVIGMLAALDRRFGGRVKRFLDAKQNATLGPLDELHRTRLDAIEEDEFVLWATFQSAMCANDSPHSTGGEDLDSLRSFPTWPSARKRSALGYYRAVLLKKHYRAAVAGRPERTIVAKNPAFSHRLGELVRVFPDAKFIHLVRDPAEAIPSRLHLIRAIWRQRFPDFVDMTKEQIETIVDDSVRAFRGAEEGLRAIASEARIRIDYRAFVADPEGTIATIYRHFGWGEPGEGARAELARATSDRPRRQANRPRNTPEEFGLSRERLHERIGETWSRPDATRPPEAERSHAYLESPSRPRTPDDRGHPVGDQPEEHLADLRSLDVP